MKTHKQYEEELFEKEINFQPIEEYRGAKIKIKHVCINDHVWEVTPTNILTGKGCPHCLNKKYRTPLEYMEELVHRNIIPLEDFIGTAHPIKHLCGTCDHIWVTKPSHVLSKHGCPNCADTRKTTAEYKQELINLGIKYEVLEEYVMSHTPINHKCNKCKGIWKAQPSNIKNGTNCPTCSDSNNFYTNNPTKLYYIRIDKDGNKYYKIGITCRDILKRFYKDKDIITILHVEEFITGKYAYIKEREILQKFNNDLVGKSNILQNGGNTEIFNRDVLNLDVDIDLTSCYNGSTDRRST